MRELNIIFAGSGEFGLPALRALLKYGHHVVQAVSQPDRPAGRGNRLLPTPVSRFAIEHGLPLLRTGNINAESLSPADLLIVIAFGQKISVDIANHARLGSVNLHASRLPKLRGAAPINWAILRGETLTGNSVIRLAQKMDAGAILAQSELTIGPLETAGELHNRLAEDGARIMLETVECLAKGATFELPQNEAAATLAPKLSRDIARIDWQQNATHIARQIRGLFPWPACHVRLMDVGGNEKSRLTLVRAQPHVAGGSQRGQIGPNGLIGAGEGSWLEILEIQPLGKRPMSFEAYRNGNPWPVGWSLESS